MLCLSSCLSLGFFWVCVLCFSLRPLFSGFILCFFVFCLLSGCQYQRKWLTGKTGLRNDILLVDGDVKPYSFRPSLIPSVVWGVEYWYRILSNRLNFLQVLQKGVGTGVNGLTIGLATVSMVNRSLYCSKTSWKISDELGARKSSALIWHCWLGDRRPVSK